MVTLVETDTQMAIIRLVAPVGTETLALVVLLTVRDTVSRPTQLNVSEKPSERGRGIEKAAMRRVRVRVWNGMAANAP